jgi:hypothetical protein
VLQKQAESGTAAVPLVGDKAVWHSRKVNVTMMPSLEGWSESNNY